MARVSSREAHLGYWLRMVSNHVSHAFGQKVADEDVTVAEWVVLRELLAQGITTPSTIAKRMKRVNLLDTAKPPIPIWLSMAKIQLSGEPNRRAVC